MTDEVMSSSPDSQEQANPGKLGDRGARTDVRVYTTTTADLGSVPVPEDQPVCWICLDGATPSQALFKPCACPRMAHPTCVARWQLQSAGTRKETHCEFCDKELPDWKRTLTPQCGANAPAVMNVNFDGRTYSFEVKPGPDGYRQFTEAIRRAFNLPDDSELNITFTCDEPIALPLDSPTASQMVVDEVSAPTTPSGSLLTLQGAGAYDAAVHCASVSAARRIMQHQGSVASSPRYMGSSGGSPFTGRRGGAPSGLSPTSDPRIQRPQSGGQASQGQRQGSGDDGAGGSSRRPAAPNMFQKAVRKLTGRRNGSE